jgi:phospholipid N-methyltransferase
VARKIVSLVPVEAMRRVVEIGSGTGRLTQEVLHRLPKDATLICVEKNADFCTYLRHRFAGRPVEVVNLAAEELPSRQPSLAPGSVDCVILSLPARLVPPEVRLRWIELSRAMLRDGGYLVIQQFMPVLSGYLKNPVWRLFRREWFLDFPPFRADVFVKQSPSNGHSATNGNGHP